MDGKNKKDREYDPDYEQWLKDTDSKDTRLNYEWYHLSDDERYEFMKKHPHWR